MQHLTQTKVPVLFVAVPEGAKDFKLIDNELIYTIHVEANMSINDGKGYDTEESIQGDFDGFQILDFSDSLTDDQKELIVEFLDFGSYKVYRNYDNRYSYFKEDGRNKAYASLLQREQIYSVNPFGEEPNFSLQFLDKRVPSDYEISHRDLDSIRDQWQTAQTRTKTWLVLAAVK